MKLLNSDVKQYQQIYKKYFGEIPSDDEARKQLTDLVRQVQIIYQPITLSQLESYFQERSQCTRK